MSKVIMSLKEYDELIDKLHKYERLVKQLTTPVLSSWDYEYFQKNPKIHLQLYGKLRDNDLIEFFKEEILKNVIEDRELSEKLSCYSEPEFVTPSIHLFAIRHEEQEEITEVGEG